MANEDDQIRIDLKSDTSEGERARKKLAEVEAQVKDLKSSFEQGNVTLARYNQELRNLEGQAKRAQAALDRIKPPKLSGTDRAGAVSRAGLLGANILQDAVQGGPASTINNFLGAANDRGIKALAGEALAAAGGIKVVTAALGTFAAVAGTAFLTVSEGLHSNNLEWGDLTSVIDKMTDGAISKTGKVASETLGSIRDTLAEMVGSVADVTIGWNEAAQAVRTHKDEIERATEALAAYEKAAKAISGIKSDAQKDQEEKGQEFGKALANAGGDKGLAGTIDRLADEQAGRFRDKLEDVEVNVLDKDGKATGETRIVQKTRKQLAAEAITQDVAKAVAGDKDAQAGLRKRMENAGIAPESYNKARDERMREAEEGVQEDLREQEADDKKKREEKNERMREAEEGAQEDIRKQEEHDKKTALEKAEKATSGTGVGARIDDALLRSALKSGGQTGVATKEVTDQLSKELQGKGLTKEEADSAASQMAEKHAAALGDDVNARAMSPAKLDAPERVASVDFARKVEASGAKTMDAIAGNTEAMKDQLAELVAFKRKGPRLD